MEYKINDFEGPLDLLLHLIKDSEVNICDINIVEITDQYLDFINKIEEMNLNIASEYLVLASELIEIKSNSLLPKKELQIDDEYEVDPREELISRLLEYEKYKNITESLKQYELERQGIFSKEPYDLNDILERSDGIDEKFEIDDLLEAFNSILRRKVLSRPLNTKITTKEYSISERSNQIKDILKRKGKVEFKELFDICSKDYIVVTFLSILTMARNQEISIKQEKNFDDIILEGKGE